jgi:hypothetical protein
MKAHASELQRYETLLNHARRALVQVSALERRGPDVDGHTRAALIQTLEEGLARLDAQATHEPQANRLARRHRALAQLSAEAQDTFADLGVTDEPSGVEHTRAQDQG